MRAEVESAPHAPDMRTYWAVAPDDGSLLMEIAASTPRDAALKAATRGVTEICLADAAGGKLHVFSGLRHPLSGSEITEYTQSRSITHRPVVAKMAYRNLGVSLGRADIPALSEHFKDMTA